jgi:hypothetical protein
MYSLGDSEESLGAAMFRMEVTRDNNLVYDLTNGRRFNKKGGTMPPEHRATVLNGYNKIMNFINKVGE